MSSAGWGPDRLDGFESLTIALPGAALAPGEGAEPTAVLVRRIVGLEYERAVLYVHGWNDYFFQTHLAEFFTDLGFAFYALDLRRYGRARTADQLPGYITDLDDYGHELDAAYDMITGQHRRVSVMAHSTGGLITALWADAAQPALDALVLNSPWLDLQASQTVRALGAPLVAGLGARTPTTVLRLAETGFYGRTLHHTLEGEWRYDLELKSSPGPPIRAAWLAAVMAGHHRVAAGLKVACPVLVMASGRTDFRRRWSEELRTADVVLDVEQIAARSVRLGDQVTLLRFPGGLHDLVLSAEPVRTQVFAALARWLTAYALGD